MDKRLENNSFLKKLRENGISETVLNNRVRTYYNTVAGLELCGGDGESVHFEDFFRDLLPIVFSKSKAYDSKERNREVASKEKKRRDRARMVLKALTEKLGH